MPQEIELKFSLAPGDIQRLARVPMLARYMADARVEKLTSVYFDTDDRRLREKGLSLLRPACENEAITDN